jgi:hypothetical protein
MIGSSPSALRLREDKQAGGKVKELGEQGALESCTSIDLEYGYHGALTQLSALRVAAA